MNSCYSSNTLNIALFSSLTHTGKNFQIVYLNCMHVKRVILTRITDSNSWYYWLYTLDSDYTKSLRTSSEASCGHYPAETARLTAVVFEAKCKAMSGNSTCLLFVFRLFFALLFSQIQIHYSAYYSPRIEYE